MFIKKLVMCSMFSLLSATAGMASATTVNYVYGNSKALTTNFATTTIFANLAVTTTDKITYNFVLKTFDLNALNPSSFIGSAAGDTTFAKKEALPTATLTGLGNGVSSIGVSTAGGPGGVYDFRYIFGGGQDRLSSNEFVSWTSVFAMKHTFDAGLFALHLQGLTEDQGDSAWFTPNLSPVPVPAALPLMASALGIFGLARRRNKSKAF